MRIRVRFVRGSHAHVHVALGNHGTLSSLPLTEGIVDFATHILIGDIRRSLAGRGRSRFRGLRGLAGLLGSGRVGRLVRGACAVVAAGLSGLAVGFALCRLRRTRLVAGISVARSSGIRRLLRLVRLALVQWRDGLLDLVQPRGRPLRQADLLVGTDQPVDGARCGLHGRAVLLLDVPLHRQLIQTRLRERPAEVPVPADLVVVVLQAFLGGQHALRGRPTGIVEENLHVARAGELLHVEVQVRLRKVRRHFKLMRLVKSSQARPDRAPLVSEVRVLRGMPQHRAGLA